MTVAKPVGDMTDSPVALITGGSSGIGAAAARELLARGCRVAVTARDSRRLERLSEDLDRPAELLTLVGDAADHDAVHSAVEATVRTFGRLDAAVANAGFATHDDLASGDPTGWRDMVLTNVLGPALLVNAALPAQRSLRGASCSSAASLAVSSSPATSTERPSGRSPGLPRTGSGRVESEVELVGVLVSRVGGQFGRRQGEDAPPAPGLTEDRPRMPRKTARTPSASLLKMIA
jgi:NAD(P)-dependent dehydrogenase (short-subunit alcohol dehydrogenase family)